eukprot:5167933-Prymnesium_polylepis.1
MATQFKTQGIFESNSEYLANTRAETQTLGVITATPSNAFSGRRSDSRKRQAAVLQKQYFPTSPFFVRAARGCPSLRQDAGASSKECQGCQLVEPWWRSQGHHRDRVRRWHRLHGQTPAH